MSRKKTRGFIVAAPSSGAGKTTVTLGLLRALAGRGRKVQPFKAGPDYIDPGHHRSAAGRASYNLDTWMMGADGVSSTFRTRSAGADVAVVEGVMGLFDGRGGGAEGSTAHIARVLGLPVLLVVDSSRASTSVAAVVKGFEGFDAGVDVRWVVFNRVGSPRHLDMLRTAVEGHTGVKVLGGLYRNDGLVMPSRHLGLVTAGEAKGFKRFVDRAAALVEEGLDLDLLVRSSPAFALPGPAGRGAKPLSTPGARIAVARDRAFCFYYEENLDLLRSSGAELVETSPISSARLPRGIGGLYLGGGYPELHGAELSGNARFRDDVKRAASSGMPVFAECGGLMYLGRSLRDPGGERHPMAGVFPWAARMGKRRAALGYREAELLPACPFPGAAGKIRGHEYHYSELSPAARSVAGCFAPAPGSDPTPGFVRGNVLATYLHVHFASNPGLARAFVEKCAGWKVG